MNLIKKNHNTSVAACKNIVMICMPSSNLSLSQHTKLLVPLTYTYSLCTTGTVSETFGHTSYFTLTFLAVSDSLNHNAQALIFH